MHKLEDGAEISVHCRSKSRGARDPGHIGRRGVVQRIAYSAVGETRAYVELAGTLAQGRAREWLYVSELQVIGPAPRDDKGDPVNLGGRPRPAKLRRIEQRNHLQWVGRSQVTP
jgi:hypothetical protein